MKNGGEFHEYLNDRVTHIIASNLAQTKAAHMRNKTVVKPEWILDSVKMKKVLNPNDYSLEVLSKISKNQNKLNEFIDKNSKTINEITLPKENVSISNNHSESALKSGNFDSKNENFLSEFYGKSRLHLISTLATDLKLYISNLRNKTIKRDIIQLPENLYNKSQELFLRKEERVIFHGDIDCFFASVSLRDKPHLENEPVGIAHSKGKNANNDDNFSYSEIASCNYEARKFGINNGMLVGTAKRLCPNIVLIEYDFDAYSICSKQIYELVSTYTHEIKAVSCDEMFIDFTNIVVKSNGTLDPLDIASFLRREIKTKIRCPSSIGIGTNMLIARLATRKAKPNGQVWIRAGQETLNFLANMQINTLPGIGASIMSKIDHRWKITTCDELRKINKADLQTVFGFKLGLKLYEFARGNDTRPFLENEGNDSISEGVKKSVSTDVNYGIRFDTNEQVNEFFGRLSTELCDRLKKYNLKGVKLTLKVRIRDPSAPIETKKFLGCGICTEKTISTPLYIATNEPEIVTQACIALYRQTFLMTTDCKDLRGIGLQMDKLQVANPIKNNNSIDKLFSIRQKEKSETIPTIVLDDSNDCGGDNRNPSLKKAEPILMESFNNYEKDFNLFMKKIESIAKKKKRCLKKEGNLDQDFIIEEIDCIKFILNDWICWSSVFNKRNKFLFDDELYVFKGFLLYLVNFDKYLECLEVILKTFKALIIEYGSTDWILFFKQVYTEVQTLFYEKYHACLDIEI